MARYLDIAGQRYGMLTPLYRVGIKSSVSYWMCKCDCGNIKEVALTSLRTGDSKSCGCVRTPSIPFADRIHSGSIKDAESGCWNWSGSKDVGGYGRASVSLGSKNKKMTISSHRMAWIAFNGDIPDGLCVLHKCDNRACVNPDHLFLGTQQDNMQDMHKKGRGPKGYKRKSKQLDAAIDAAMKDQSCPT